MVYAAWSPSSALRASGDRRRGSCPIWKERLRSRVKFLAPTYTVSEATPCGLSHITEIACASDKLRLLASLIFGQLEAYIGMRIDMVLVWRLRGVTAEVRVYPPGPCS